MRFTDGELLEGTVGKVRKFTFVLQHRHRNRYGLQARVKYVAEVL